KSWDDSGQIKLAAPRRSTKWGRTSAWLCAGVACVASLAILFISFNSSRSRLAVHSAPARGYNPVPSVASSTARWDLSPSTIDVFPPPPPAPHGSPAPRVPPENGPKVRLIGLLTITGTNFVEGAVVRLNG